MAPTATPPILTGGSVTYNFSENIHRTHARRAQNNCGIPHCMTTITAQMVSAVEMDAW